MPQIDVYPKSSMVNFSLNGSMSNTNSLGTPASHSITVPAPSKCQLRLLVHTAALLPKRCRETWLLRECMRAWMHAHEGRRGRLPAVLATARALLSSSSTI
jgi:hypothetical protein